MSLTVQNKNVYSVKQLILKAQKSKILKLTENSSYKEPLAANCSLVLLIFPGEKYRTHLIQIFRFRCMIPVAYYMLICAI